MSGPDEPLLPDVTRDETGIGWGDDEDVDLRRLLDERPPHHEPRD
jgi:hypothetical protein